MAPPLADAAFATLLMNDAYLPGAMVLGHSLRDKGARKKLICLVTLDTLSGDSITELKTIYDDIVPVQRIYNKQPANLYLMNRPDLISTFTKIELWKLTQYKRIVYMDADMVALRAPNELLTITTDFAAVPDIGWPDCFNSGMMVLNPNMGEYYALLALAQRGISFDGADQGLLNMHFRDWERLSFVYNCTPSGNYQYLPAYRHFQSSINMVHFIGRDKPWTLGRDTKLASEGVYGDLLSMWWAVFDRHFHEPKISYYEGQYQQQPMKVRDFVRGEETIYLPTSAKPPVPASIQRRSDQSQPPTVNVTSSTGEVNLSQPQMERPVGDQPSPAEQVRQDEFTPLSTTEQRRWSAPQVEWQPTREPPPPGSRPEAANFPTTTYEMSHDTKLFEPPTNYPEAPKDMWYQIPEKSRDTSKPKPIFPWEANAPKPTRVFPRSREPSPPPKPEPEPVADLDKEPTFEASAPSVTNEESVPTPQMASPDPWSSFQDRTNAWDDVPEIARYVEAIHQSRQKGKLQVLHHTRTGSREGLPPSPTTRTPRRPSLKLTDFPTKDERPSLPVTPAPIRRPTFWGDVEKDESGMPPAEGVPKQEDWVRHFSSYPKPAFHDMPAPLVNLNGTLHFQCQYCGKQNPIARLEELQRKQNEILSGTQARLENAPELSLRAQPGSGSKDDVVKAAELSISPTAVPKPKPILKAPAFELGQEPSEDTQTKPVADDEVDPKVTETRTATNTDRNGPNIDKILPQPRAGEMMVPAVS